MHGPLATTIIPSMVAALIAVFLCITLPLVLYMAGKGLARVMLEVQAQVARVTGEVTGQVAAEVARTVAKEVGEAIRGPIRQVETEEEAGVEQLQERALVPGLAPWETWGLDGDGEGDVRYMPDPTDGVVVDEHEDNDLSKRAVVVPPGFTIPVQPNMAGEQYGVEGNGG